jgi:putative heme-binding domain-containing protein
VKREAITTLAFRRNKDAIKPLMAVAAKQSGNHQDALGGLIGQFVANPRDQELRDFLLSSTTAPLLAATAFRGGVGHDPTVVARLDELFKTAGTHVPGFTGVPDIDGLNLQWRLIFGPDRANPMTNFVGQRQPEPVNWKDVGQQGLGGDRNLGRFVFFNPQGPGCARCHTVNGRGGKVGPDLSKIGASFTHEKLIDSILEPSKEVSPQFTNWQMIHTDGRVFTGMIVHENEGKTILGDSDGKTTELKTHEIEERRPVQTSVMPANLVDRMTVQEWRDLLAYLQSLK